MMKVSNGLICAALLAGCAANPATGVATNGHPLRVRYSSGTGSYVSDDVVGTDVHRDSSGNEIGSTDHVQAVEHSYQWHDWKYFQGPDVLDEQDFYRIAGDQQAADSVAKIRAGATSKMKVGMPIAVIGYAAMLVLGSIGTSNKNPTLSTIGYVGGGTLGSVGGLVWYWGKADMAKRHHLPMSRADQNADVIETCRENHCRKQRGGRRVESGSL